MGVSYKDYYEILGVERGAEADQIRKAYRKLAKKYHPDVNKDAGAEKKYKDVNEAWEVLKDPDKRQKYDTLGENWQQGQEFTPPQGWQHRQNGAGYSQNGGGFSDFFETIFGSFNFGNESGNSIFNAQRGRDQEVEMSLSLDDVLAGGTKTIHLSDGRSSRSLKVNLPRGITEGSRIKLSGKASTGGDLHIIIHILQNGIYEINGNDLTRKLTVHPWDAALGKSVSVETLKGAVKMKIPAGTNSGQKLRLKGRGLPKRAIDDAGDLYVRIEIETPKKLSDRERELWEELSKISER